MTNVAPQMPEFNAGNWAAVEKAVKSYVDDQHVRHDVYVFTGAGISLRPSLFLPLNSPTPFAQQPSNVLDAL